MADLSTWTPKSVQALRVYDRATFLADLVAGITVGLVALPLAMAFSIASGLPPQSGIYCAIVTGFLISLLGGSRCQIGGPTGAFVVVVAGIVANHGVPGLFMATPPGFWPFRTSPRHDRGRTLLFCGAREQPRRLMAQARFAEIVGRENICDSVMDALARAKAIYEAAQVA